MDEPSQYYNILGLSDTATKEEIKKAYKVLSRKYHPDNAKNNEEAKSYADRFIEIKKAYDSVNTHLKNIKNTKIPESGYDADGYIPSFSNDVLNFDNINGSSSSSKNKRTKDKNIISSIKIDLVDIFEKKSKRFKIKIKTYCDICEGRKFDLDKVIQSEKNYNCGNCKGSGYIISANSICHSMIETYNLCDVCDGDKILLRKEIECDNCKGEGFLIKNSYVCIIFHPNLISPAVLRLKGHHTRQDNIPGDIIINFEYKSDMFIRSKNNIDLLTLYDISMKTAFIDRNIERCIFIKLINSSIIKLIIPPKKIIHPNDVYVLDNIGGLNEKGRLYILFNLKYEDSKKDKDEKDKSISNDLDIKNIRTSDIEYITDIGSSEYKNKIFSLFFCC